MPSHLIKTKCPSCRVWLERSLDKELPKGFSCMRCQTGIPIRNPKGLVNEDLKNCVICNHPFFYGEKDFPKFLRFMFLGLGIGFSFFTYGLSLLACGILDWILYKTLPMVRVCYQCQSEYRGFPPKGNFEEFDPYKGVAYDAKRAIPKI